MDSSRIAADYPFREARLLRGSIGIHAINHLMMSALSLAFVAGGVAICVYTENWGWGLVVVVLFMLGPILFVPSLLRTGRYELTTARLMWRPFVGAPREVLLRDVAPAAVSYDGQSGSVEIANPKLRMGAVGNRHRLWGGLILFSALAKLSPPTAGGPAYTGTYWPAKQGTGLRSLSGVAVLGSDYVAFVPNGFVSPPPSMRQRLATLAAGLGLAAVGMVQLVVHPLPPVPVESMLAMLARGPQSFFDAALERIVLLMGGRLAARGEVQIVPSPDQAMVELVIDGERVRAKLDPAYANFIRNQFAEAGFRRY